jgi:predicted N-acetyltransferase YhbS
MQAALSAAWIARRPLVNTGVGDLEWWVVLAGPEADWSTRIRVWPGGATGGPVRAFAWRNPPNELDGHQRWDLPLDERERLVWDAVDWAVAAARDEARLGGLEPPAELTTWAMDTDTAMAGILGGLGFVRAPEPAYLQWYRTLESLPSIPALPVGYRLRHVVPPGDLEARVQVHRAAFAPSRMTREKYELLLGQRHYDPQRDIVAVAPDGSFAAFANAWLDPVAGIGELEPVGTHPDHRRLGLALATVVAALHALREQGARDCVVLSATSSDASGPLYAKAGFGAVTSHRAWRLPLR